MTHTELVNVALGMYGPLLVGAIAADYKYGDRSDLFTSAVERQEQAVKRMLILIGKDLRDKSKTVFENASSVRSQLLGPNGKSMKRVLSTQR